ncbi:MAG: flagellar basal body rod protein FlgB [Pseudomonadales bacterium]|nr:flagellar basal body rod protein FlgB [Pseudomonadales bacterium]
MSALSLDFGLYEVALNTTIKRSELLANNIANADTPGYKARDIDFAEVMRGYNNPGSSVRMAATSTLHRSGLVESSAMEGLKYRTSAQPSIDGNTVDADKENAEYARNTLLYNASFHFLNGKIKGLIGAIRGE